MPEVVRINQKTKKTSLLMEHPIMQFASHGPIRATTGNTGALMTLAAETLIELEESTLSYDAAAALG